MQDTEVRGTSIEGPEEDCNGYAEGDSWNEGRSDLRRVGAEGQHRSKREVRPKPTPLSVVIQGQSRSSKVSDLLCWRNLEGRSCFSAGSMKVAASTDIVLIPIPPPRPKHGARAHPSTTRDQSGCPPGSHRQHVQEEQDRELSEVENACRQLQAILEQSGIAAAVDFSKRRTPGAKFSFWEAQGVLMRLEVGVREAAAGTACVWLNATYSHLLPGVLDSLPFETQSGRGLGATGELRLAGQRLHGVQASSLPELCRRLLEGFGLGDRHRHLCHSSKKECFSPGVVVHGMHVVSAEGSVGTVAMPSSLCPKLHLPDKCRGLCVAHLRWLAGAGMPCHCGTELHVSSSELKAMVASAVKERSGGSTKVKVSTWAGGPREEDEAGRQAGPAVVVVGGLVVCKPAELLVQLEEAFSAFGLVRVHGGKAKGSFRHGWARVYVDSMDNARRAAEALNGRLEHQGQILSVSLSAGRLDTLFPLLPHWVRCKLRVDSVGTFSVTDQVTADKITRIIAGVAEELLLGGSRDIAGTLLPLSITDATACSGGNTLSFMRSFASVSSVEMDADRVMDLRHNVDCIMGLASSQGLSAATVTTHQGDYVELMKQLEQDIVFIDPPWGGPAYKDGQGGLLEDLYLGEASVAWLCWDLLQTQAQIVALRLPSVLPVNVFLRAMDPSCCDDAKRKEASSREDSDKNADQCSPAESCPGPHFLDIAVHMGRSILLVMGRAASPRDGSGSAEGLASISGRLEATVRRLRAKEGNLRATLGRWRCLAQGGRSTQLPS